MYDAEDLVRKLRSLMELSALLNSTLESAEIERRAVEAAAAIVDAERGSLLLLEPETGGLRFVVAMGEDIALEHALLPAGKGIAGWVAHTGEPLIVDDVQSDPRHFGATHTDGFESRNMICVPVSSRGRLIGVMQAINKRGERFLDEDAELLAALAHQVAVAIENAGLYEELKHAFYETASVLADMIERRDPYTGGHTRRVMEHSLATGIALGLPAEEIESLHLAAILHDIGKIAVPDAILTKPGALDAVEWQTMRAHAKAAKEMLERVKRLRSILPGVGGHHERLDGTGYPDGLSGEDITMQARIIAVADAYDAMTTRRPYKSPVSPARAVAELRRCSGTQFDTRVVEAFIGTLGDVAFAEVGVA